jgi:type IX secretion system PorP/SprF family membrane protein
MNKCRKRRWFIGLTVLLCLQNGQAQTDFPISTLTSSPAQINPASTGRFNSDFRIHTYYKSQMARSLSGGIKSAGVAVDYNFVDLRMGLGLMVFSNSVDRSALRDFNLLLSYGYHLVLNEWSLLSFGLQTGFKQVGFSLESLTFGSQYDPSYKGGFDPSRQPSYITQTNNNDFNASIGAHWQGYLGPFLALNAGVAMFHLTPMKTNFLNDETHLKPKYVFATSARYEAYNLHWIPSAMFVSQSSSNFAEIGLTTQYRQADKFINAGVYYRSPNVIIPTIGIGMDKLSINLSMEYFMRNSFTQIFNISISYFPQTNRRASLIEDFRDI